MRRNSTTAHVCLAFLLTASHVFGVAAAPLQWFFLNERSASPAGINFAVAVGATLDVKEIQQALPTFKVETEELEGVSTVAISYANDNNVGVILYPGHGKVSAIETFGSAGSSLGVRTGMPIDQVPGATPAKCSLDELTALYDCATGSAFHYRVDPSKCLLSPLPEKLPGFADCLTIVSIILGKLPE